MEQPDLALNAPFLNDDPEHRQALIAALKAHGLEAHEYGSGGGFNHVCVYLVAEKQDWLAVATGSMESECEVGLFGDRNQYQVGNEFDKHPITLTEVVNSFEEYWGEKEKWIGMYHEGLLDYK